MEFLLEKLAREAVEEDDRQREEAFRRAEREKQAAAERYKSGFRTLLRSFIPELVEQAYIEIVEAECRAKIPAAQGIAICFAWSETKRNALRIFNEAYPALGEEVTWDELNHRSGLVRRWLLLAVASVLDKVRRAEATREANRAA